MRCPLPQLLPTDGPSFPPEEPGLEGLVGQNLGDVETFFAGLDAILNLPLSSFSGDLATLQGLADLLSAASFTEGVYDAAVIAPLIAEYQALQVSGDALVLATLGQLAGGPSLPTVPEIPQEPDPSTIDIGVPSPGSGGGEVGGIPQPPPSPGNNCPGYGFIQGPCVPIDAPPTIPSQTPVPQPGGNCLNPTPGGGYQPGPCPNEPQPQPEPAPAPPEPEPAPAPEPAPEPAPAPLPAPEPEPVIPPETWPDPAPAPVPEPGPEPEIPPDTWPEPDIPPETWPDPAPEPDIPPEPDPEIPPFEGGWDYGGGGGGGGGDEGGDERTMDTA